MTRQVTTGAVLQPFREAPVTVLVHSTPLDTTVTGGRLRSTMLHSSGTIPLVSFTAVFKGTSQTGTLAFLFVASGIIDLFAYLPQRAGFIMLGLPLSRVLLPQVFLRKLSTVFLSTKLTIKVLQGYFTTRLFP